MNPILHGQGAQTLRHLPIDAQARPRVVSSATFAIVDLRWSETSPDRAIDSGSATVDAVSTTLAADAGPGESNARLVTVASASGITSGRRYLITRADGQAELVMVRAVSGAAVYLHFELTHDFATGATFRGIDITAQFPALEANDEDEIEAARHPYQVTWSYTIDGEVYLVPEVVWIGRTSVVPLVDEIYVLRAAPTIGERLSGRSSIVDAIAVAHDDYTAEVRARGVDPEEFRGNDTSRVAVRARALQYAYEWCGPAEHDVALASRFRSQYEYLMNQLLSGRPRPGTVTVDTPTNLGGQDTKASHSLFRRR